MVFLLATDKDAILWMLYEIFYLEIELLFISQAEVQWLSTAKKGAYSLAIKRSRGRGTLREPSHHDEVVFTLASSRASMPSVDQPVKIPGQRLHVLNLSDAAPSKVLKSPTDFITVFLETWAAPSSRRFA